MRWLLLLPLALTLLACRHPALAAPPAPVATRDLSKVDPPFPRIANCYGTGLGWGTWEQNREYWSKVSLVIGGCYDVHYDWDNARWAKTLPHCDEMIAKLREVNPHVLVLPYVDVIEGVDNPKVPQAWWDLNAKGERWQGWPGMFRINTKLPAVLRYNLDQVRDNVLGRPSFDGVFYDCWSPDPWLCPRTAQLRGGRAVVMTNDGHFPRAGFESLNGVLSEDELNRVVEGKVDYADFLDRYFQWCTKSRKPVVTTIVCRPQQVDDDPWRWAKMTSAERQKLRSEAKDSDPQTMRFGLTTTLLGDGYFAYDTGTAGRGNHWWYPEFSAPLGHPKVAAHKDDQGLWWREFDGGRVVVNGTQYDAAITVERPLKDLSTGRVSRQFTVPMFDGRILLPTSEPETAQPPEPPHLTAQRPQRTEAVTLDRQKLTVVRTPDGLDLRFDALGRLQAILFGGQTVGIGGFPVVAAPPFQTFRTALTSADPPHTLDGGTVRLVHHYRLSHEAQQVELTQTVTVGPTARFTLHYDLTAVTALDIRMWRHYFSFPVADYQGRPASAGGQSIALPTAVSKDPLLPGSRHVELTGPAGRVTVDSTLAMGLVDHRAYGSPDYLLAGYLVSGAVKAGTKATADVTMAVAK